jgi:predicted TIM-barrel fold metal-dependent hydrolase
MYRLTASGAKPDSPAPNLDVRAPAFRIPPGAVDAHAHVFGPPERYPHSDSRFFNPPAVYLPEYRAMLRGLGIERGVIVQSATHGTDNTVTLDAIAADPERLRGVALLAEGTLDAEIARLDAGGIRGFRVNLVAKAGMQLDAARRLAERVRPFGWHVQFLMNVEDFPELDRTFADFPTDVMIDHMGRPDPARGVQAPGFQALIRLLQSGRGWSKLAAPYRTSRFDPPYPDMQIFAQALVQAAPDRLVWGSDWPHVMVETRMPNTGELLDLLADWVPDEGTRSRILVDNPARLYRL